MDGEMLVGIAAGEAPVLEPIRKGTLPTESVLLPTNVVALFFETTARDLALVRGSGKEKKFYIPPSYGKSKIDHALHFADAVRMGVLLATRQYVELARRKSLWKQITPEIIEEAAYADPGRGVWLVIPAESLRGGPLKVEFRRPGDPQHRGDLVLNLTGAIRELWHKTEQYLRAAMTAHAARQEGPQAERQNLERILRQFEKNRRDLGRRWQENRAKAEGTKE